MPRNCNKYGKMIPPIVYEIARILLPKKFTVASISRHPDFLKNSHRDMLLQAVFKLTGQRASNRIPSMLRKQPKLFFQGFEQLKARAAKVAKEDPDLGMTAVAVTDDKAAVAKAGSRAVAAEATAYSAAVAAPFCGCSGLSDTGHPQLQQPHRGNIVRSPLLEHTGLAKWPAGRQNDWLPGWLSGQKAEKLAG